MSRPQGKDRQSDQWPWLENPFRGVQDSQALLTDNQPQDWTVQPHAEVARYNSNNSRSITLYFHSQSHNLMTLLKVWIHSGVQSTGSLALNTLKKSRLDAITPQLQQLHTRPLLLAAGNPKSHCTTKLTFELFLMNFNFD